MEYGISLFLKDTLPLPCSEMKNCETKHIVQMEYVMGDFVKMEYCNSDNLYSMHLEFINSDFRYYTWFLDYHHVFLSSHRC
uniref:Uncharacterized protein n=1 Tax=Arundo donax TaxID=35708 RepID=A0A0A9EIT6_ARUDO